MEFLQFDVMRPLWGGILNSTLTFNLVYILVNVAVQFGSSDGLSGSLRPHSLGYVLQILITVRGSW